MKVVKLDLDFLIGPIVKDVFSESKNVLVTGVDVIDNDEVIADLDKRIMELYSSFYSFDEKDSCKFDVELANSHKDELNRLVKQLIDCLNKIKELMLDDEITNKKGIYPYLFDGLEKHLNLRSFTPAQRIKAYNRQHGKCPRCKAMHKPTASKVWDIEEMEADHITPWHLGGKTDDANCQMLCRTCNREKSGH